MHSQNRRSCDFEGCDCSTDLKNLPIRASSVFGDLILQRRRAARTRSPLVSYILCAFEIR